MGPSSSGGQTGGHKDGGGAVGAADDADGGGLGGGEHTAQTAAGIGHEDAQLSGSAQQQALGVGDQGPKSVMQPTPRKIRQG